MKRLVMMAVILVQADLVGIPRAEGESRSDALAGVRDDPIAPDEPSGGLRTSRPTTATNLVGRVVPNAPRRLEGKPPYQMSPYAPAQIIPASEKTTRQPLKNVREIKEKAGRRARPPRERRLRGNIPGLVTIPYGKTASGKRTQIYRIMGQGGVVMDFTDYGARVLRAYTPDATGDLKNIIQGAKLSVIDCEKAGDLAEVWKMTPIRRPRATGLVFELEGEQKEKRTERTETTKRTSSQDTASKSENVPRIVYWLDAQNRFSVESTIADTNAVKWTSSLTLAPLTGRSVEIKSPAGASRYSATTNATQIVLRPTTNITQKVELLLGTR